MSNLNLYQVNVLMTPAEKQKRLAELELCEPGTAGYIVRANTDEYTSPRYIVASHIAAAIEVATREQVEGKGRLVLSAVQLHTGVLVGI